MAPEGPYAWSKAAGEALVEKLDGGKVRWPVSVRTLAETCVSMAREKGIGNSSIEWTEDVQAGPSFGMRIEKAG